jgi:hypothetical protein
VSSIRQHYRRLKMNPLKAGHGLEQSQGMPRLPSDEFLGEKATLR